ncbi:MAG: hypothetical protein ABIR54_05735 [Burkholderiaceae bacterium]|jgi:hypothetical protein
MPVIRSLAAFVATAAATLTLTAPVQAATWAWNHDASGIAAAGTFTTADTADADGFYAITSISGSRNGVATRTVYVVTDELCTNRQLLACEKRDGLGAAV